SCSPFPSRTSCCSLPRRPGNAGLPTVGTVRGRWFTDRCCWRQDVAGCRDLGKLRGNAPLGKQHEHAKMGVGMTTLPATAIPVTPLPVTRSLVTVPPPTHLADLDLAGRRAAVAELGERPFRAGQLSHHYFGRLV